MKEVKAYIKRNRLLVELIIFFVGIILIFMSAHYSTKEDTYFSDLLLNLGSGFLSSAIIAFILSSLIIPEDNIDEKFLKEYSIQIVDYLEISSYKEKIKHFIKKEDSIIQTSIHYDEIESKKLIQCYTVKKDVLVGNTITTRLNYFIDLMEVVSNQDNLNTLANHMCHLINRTCKECEKGGKTIYFSKIATPKGGNPVLAALVAQKLNKQCIFYNEKDLFTKNMGPLEGNIIKDEEIIIIHDVIISGNRINRCVDYLIDGKKAKISHVFVFVERTDRGVEEISPRKLLMKRKISLHSLHRYDDDSLAKLYEGNL